MNLPSSGAQNFSRARKARVGEFLCFLRQQGAAGLTTGTGNEKRRTLRKSFASGGNQGHNNAVLLTNCREALLICMFAPLHGFSVVIGKIIHYVRKRNNNYIKEFMSFLYIFIKT